MSPAYLGWADQDCLKRTQKSLPYSRNVTLDRCWRREAITTEEIAARSLLFQVGTNTSPSVRPSDRFFILTPPHYPYTHYGLSSSSSSVFSAQIGHSITLCPPRPPPPTRRGGHCSLDRSIDVVSSPATSIIRRSTDAKRSRAATALAARYRVGRRGGGGGLRSGPSPSRCPVQSINRSPSC